MNKKKPKYTTIQVRKDLNEAIRNLCKQRGWIASSITENYWIGVISASMSGSVTV